MAESFEDLRAALERREQELEMREAQLERYAADLREVFQQERRREEDLRRSYAATVRALANAVEARDAYTGKHAERVTAYGVALACAVGLDIQATPEVEFGFLLHDVGKVAIPDSILFKPGRLTDREYAQMQRHPIVGAEILRDVDFLGDGKVVVRHHHERWDGMGYPDRLSRDEIPLVARVFAVADALDALTSDRPYRRACGFDEARAEIRRGSGSHFCPTVIDGYETLSDTTLTAMRDAIG